MSGNNPLHDASARTSVYIAQGGGAYANTRNALQHVNLAPARGKRVLLKPNAGRIAISGSGIITHADVVAAAIDAFRAAGADVIVGESPIVGVSVQEAFDSSGISAVARQRECPLIDMDRRRFVEVAVPDGRAIHTLRVCAEVLEADLVVSLPVMKTHMHTRVTLTIKNMKGCLWRRSKVELHMLPPVEGIDEKPIDVAIADMSSVLRPQLAIIDGTVGMEGLGPSAGLAKPMDVVIVSTDAFAADAAACQLMGTRAEQIPHLRMSAERGYGVIDLSCIDVTPGNWLDFASPFCAPPENLSIEFPNVTVLDSNSCSACQSTLLLFLRRYEDRLFDYLPSETPANIAIGKGHSELPDGTLLIGNCTSHQRDKGIFVSGCPPVGSQIWEALTGQSQAEDGDARVREPLPE